MLTIGNFLERTMGLMKAGALLGSGDPKENLGAYFNYGILLFVFTIMRLVTSLRW